MNDDFSGFSDWQAAFDDWHDISISELHGLIAAVMTTCLPANKDVWAMLFDELCLSRPDDDALELISQYAEDISFELKDQDDAYAFTPLVPDDEHDLSERFLALKNWAGGFITGLGISEIALSQDEQAQIRDLLKIASIRPDDDDKFDGDEEEYLHLFEFVRFIPVLLYRKNHKKIKDLPIIKGLSPERLTAKEAQTLPPVFNAMHKKS
ncbi:MAG: UPF0149 family protein [Moraxella sp.]